MPAHAQLVPRAIEVPASSDWTHADTGMVFPASVASMPRVSLADMSKFESYVVAKYQAPDGSITATISLLKSPARDVSIWFDRAQTMFVLKNRVKAGAVPTAFAPTANGTANSLRIVYDHEEGQEWASTALAVVPFNGRMVKLQLSARSLPSDQLGNMLLAAVRSMSWTVAKEQDVAAVPISPCPERLSFKRATLLAPELAFPKRDRLPPIIHNYFGAPKEGAYCREREGDYHWAVYRKQLVKHKYLIALQDAGRVIEVEQVEHEFWGQGYSVVLVERDGRYKFRNFDQLPTPDRVIELIEKDKPISSVIRTR